MPRALRCKNVAWKAVRVTCHSEHAECPNFDEAEEALTAQVGFGSGFKCNSVVWKAIRNIHDTEHAEWAHMKNPANLDRCWNYIQVCCLPP